MEIDAFVNQLKSKYDYSDEMEQFLKKAVPAIITYYGEDKKNIIFASLSECEIHIQKENENTEQYLNQYFGTNKEWDIPFLGGAFQHTELSLNNNQVNQKNIIYLKTEYLHMYKPFDFNDEKKLSSIIHEMCHAIKGYGKLKVEDGKVITSTGLIKDYYEYDRESNSFKDTKSDNTGLEEAFNSYDEASIMTIMTGRFQEYGAYKGMTQIARKLMKHEELAQIIRISQFSGGNEWIEFLGKEDSEYLSKNFEEWISVLYSSPSELMNDKLGLMEKMNMAIDKLTQFVNNYTSPKEFKQFDETRKNADETILQHLKQIIQYRENNNLFEVIQENETKTL